MNWSPRDIRVFADVGAKYEEREDLKSEIRPGILKTADSSSGSPASESSPAGLVSSPGVGGSIDSNLGIVGSSSMDTFRMS